MEHNYEKLYVFELFYSGMPRILTKGRRSEIMSQTRVTIFHYISVLRTDSRNSQQKVMARYGISADLSGTVSPVNLDIEYFNLGMIYQNAIFIITDPGYYRITLQCYHNQNGAQFSKYAFLKLNINNQNMLRTYCMWANNGNADGIFYLEAFDTVFVEKGGEKLFGGGYYNNFMIEKI